MYKAISISFDKTLHNCDSAIPLLSEFRNRYEVVVVVVVQP